MSNIYSFDVQGKAVEVVKVLSESQWTSSCVITMKKFQDICGGTREASAVLSYLSGCGKAQYISTSKKELIEVHDSFISLGLFKCDYQIRCSSNVGWRSFG